MLQNVQRWALLSQGHTIEEAIANLKEATELYLEECPLKNL
jgi:predicted RNase H-like HicB family nuclease